MFDRMTLYRIAWSANAGCVLIAVFVARTWLRDSWRLYSAMGLFACAWMLALATYGAPPETLTGNERKLINYAQDFAAILFVFSGALLVGDVHTRRAGHPVGVSWELRVPLALLFSLAGPTAIAIPTSPFGQLIQEWLGIKEITAGQVGNVVSEILIFAGFSSLARGVHQTRTEVRKLSGMSGPGNIFKLFTAILVFYWLISLYRQYENWEPLVYVPTKEAYVLAVSLAKLLTTILFCFAVVSYAKAGPPKPSSTIP